MKLEYGTPGHNRHRNRNIGTASSGKEIVIQTTSKKATKLLPLKERIRWL